MNEVGRLRFRERIKIACIFVPAVLDNRIMAKFAGKLPALPEIRPEVVDRKIDQPSLDKGDALEQLREVKMMNSRWQKHNKEREIVIAQLMSQQKESEGKVQELTEKVQHLKAKLIEQENISEEMELRWTDARVRAAERKAELDRIQREHEILQHRLKQSEKKQLLDTSKSGGGSRRHDVDKDRDLYHMSKRVEDLIEEVTRYKRKIAEQTELYTQQIQLCMHDFKQEKIDRERSQKENVDLKKQLNKVEALLNFVTDQITRYHGQQREKPLIFDQPADIYGEKGDVTRYEISGNSLNIDGFTLPSDVVHGQPTGVDETDLVRI